ncbi:NADP-binding protein [Dacryopinax primogenitus]|uniref:NADP-binding protein n=1 Tax=Dacryopinax primogenitus (strain DJM 731) TaxID=1858805 RepID=M5FQK0_DACPD|nr:NADP-binding protein [Dacryopinax primogenitus]EJT99175.1 NADP-binding protein [Dacryopinax primogenitus]
MAARKPILVVAGVGTGAGTGGSTARLFAKHGYSVALIARNAKELEATAEEIKAAGGTAAAFPIVKYDYKEIHDAFDAIKKHWPDEELRVAVWNAGYGVWKPFLEVTEEEVKESVQINIVAAAAFAQEAILAFQKLEVDNVGARGNLIVTSATAAWRGNLTTSAFAAGKHGLKGLAQSLNKEFGKQNIHVSHAIIDGSILTNRSRGRGDEYVNNPDVRLDPDSIAKAYFYLAQQDRSAWTFELDLRPAHEKW